MVETIDYSKEDEQLVVDCFMALNCGHIRGFLERYELPKSGTKDVLRERVTTALGNDDITCADLLCYIDIVEPWGKQHIFLYSAPEGTLRTNWRNADWVKACLERDNMDHLLNEHCPLALPQGLTVSEIMHTESKLKVFAVEKREYYERDKDHDNIDYTEDGDEIELRAYLHHVKRGIVIFEWDLVSNNAMLQISQLASGTKYKEVAERFQRMIAPWLNIDQFSLLDISPTISSLHKAEENGSPEARTHTIDYTSIGGSHLQARSPSATDSPFGEEVIENAMTNIRNQGVGHIGNFFWLPQDVNPAHNNTLDKEVHINIIASKNRIAFTTSNKEEHVRYVLSRVRSLSN